MPYSKNNFLKHKIYIAVCGIPDCGKSTFIKTLVTYMTNRIVDIDSFCNEQVLDRTIRSSQIVYRDVTLPFDYVFLDCPGHIDEYPEEIESCISKAHIVLHIIDSERENESLEYIGKIENCMKKYNLTKSYKLYSHSSENNDLTHYDAKTSTLNDFRDLFLAFSNFILQDEDISQNATDPMETAIRVIKLACNNFKNITAMCSFGKDSVALLYLFKLANVLDKIKIMYPVSGYDLDGINESFIKKIKDFIGCEITPFSVTPDGWTFENHSVQDMMLQKAVKLNELVKKEKYDCVFTGIRRDEEGTRAKEKFFSVRDINGEFDCYKSQLEIFGDELNKDCLNIDGHIRVNPLLDLTESDIWNITREFSIPFCDNYVSKGGYRYRSLGDWPITTPIQSEAKTIDDICHEVEVTLIPERACRALQDKSVKYGMEKLRTKGFF